MKKLKLTSINASMLNRVEMMAVSAGKNSAGPKQMWDGDCACGCLYSSKGGSSTVNNGNANVRGKKVTLGMKAISKMSDAEIMNLYN